MSYEDLEKLIEPEAKMLSQDSAIQLSIAISLKRIADAMEKHTPLRQTYPSR